MVSRCGFTLRFPDDSGRGAPFDMSVSYLYVRFGGPTIRVCDLFFDVFPLFQRTQEQGALTAFRIKMPHPAA